MGGEELSCKSTVLEQRRALKTFTNTLDHIHEHAERNRFQRWKPAPLPPSESSTEFSEKVPWALFASVAADGGVDGLLFGLILQRHHLQCHPLACEDHRIGFSASHAPSGSWCGWNPSGRCTSCEPSRLCCLHRVCHRLPSVSCDAGVAGGGT